MNQVNTTTNSANPKGTSRKPVPSVQATAMSNSTATTNAGTQRVNPRPRISLPVRYQPNHTVAPKTTNAVNSQATPTTGGSKSHHQGLGGTPAAVAPTAPRRATSGPASEANQEPV